MWYSVGIGVGSLECAFVILVTHKGSIVGVSMQVVFGIYDWCLFNNTLVADLEGDPGGAQESPLGCIEVLMIS